MSRKHFEAVAAKIKSRIQILASEMANDHTAYNTAVNIARDFAEIAANDNPRFDTRRFLTACGINS